MQYYENLRKARVKAKMNQSEVADRLNTTQYQISKYELGKQELTVPRFKELCLLYNVSADDILEIQKSER